jgi:hypothetical protein
MINPIYINILKGQARTLSDADLITYQQKINDIVNDEFKRRGIRK